VTISTGIITTIAGTGTQSFSGDNGPATSAAFSIPYGITVDTSGNVYIADRGNHRIRKVTISTGIITTIAGTGSTTFSGDGGAATAANLNLPHGVCIDATNSMYISDSSNNRIRKMSIVIPR
jgi:sugar lactone lactonase YvrE